MRILLLTSTFFPKIGGAETYILNISRALGALGHRIEIVTDGAAAQPLPKGLDEATRVTRVHKYRQYLKAPDRIFWEEMQFGLRPEVAEVARVFEPDVVFSNSLDLCFIAKLTSLTQRVPWVATFHEQAPERDPMGPATLRVSYGLLSPDAVIAGSDFYFQRARGLTSPEKCHLIYHGIDTQSFRPLHTRQEVRERYRIPPHHLLLVSLGRFKARKGFDILIEAVAVLAQAGLDISLVIAGSLNSASASYLAEIQALVRSLQLETLVHFENELPHQRASWLLSGADVAVQASREEGLGLAVIEAMACGTPVVATEIPGHREIVDDFGQILFVKPSSPEGLAAAINSLARDPLLQRTLRANARERVLRAFSLDSMGAATAALLAKTTAGYDAAYV